MNTITIPSVSDELHRRLAERAKVNQRSIEEEAVCCLLETIESDEAALNAIPQAAWKEIESSVAETIHDRGTPLTDGDFQRYREMARGRNRS